MPLKDIVLYLGNKRATGTLALHRGDVSKEAQIHEGCVLSGSSNQPREYLGQFLINMGHLSEEQFMKAYETQKETRIFMGKILVMIGLVPEDVVKSALNMKLRETLLEAFGWPDGDFTFTPTDKAPELEGLEASVDLLDIYREGEFRETAWQAIRAVFPHGKLKLILDDRRAPPPQPGTMDERLFRHIKDGLTIDEMLLAMHATDFYAYQRLYALFRLEAVRVDDSPASVETELEIETDEPITGPTVMGDESSDNDVANAARQYLQIGNFKDGHALARRAFEMNPTPANAGLLKQAESEFVAHLKGTLMGRKQIPTLAVTPQKLKSMELSAPEKYLLSRIDGRKDLASIIHVSPINEGEALKLIQAFVDSGVIRLAS